MLYLYFSAFLCLNILALLYYKSVEKPSYPPLTFDLYIITRKIIYVVGGFNLVFMVTFLKMNSLRLYTEGDSKNK